MIKRIPGTLLVCVLFAMTSCEKGSPTKPEQQPNPDDTVKKNAGHHPRNDLTRVQDMDKYQISLPVDFAALPMPQNLPPFIKTYSWQGPSKENVPSALITATVFTEGPGPVLDEAKKSVRQFLVNFSAGVTDSLGFKITQRGPTEQFTFNDIAFSRFKWTGAAQNQKPASGFAYGAIIGTDVVAITTLHLDAAKATETSELMESILATFKKK